MRRISKSAALIVAATMLTGVVFQSTPAHAALAIHPAIQSFYTSGSNLFNDGTTLGYSFEVLGAPFHVDHLGIWDDSILGSEFPDGLFLAHETGIWDATGNLLVSAIVDEVTSTLKDNFWWTKANATLAPGSYIIGAYYPQFQGSGVGSQDFAADNVSNLMTQPGIVFGENLRSTIGAPFTQPTVSTSSQGISWFGPNFAGSSSVPGPLPLLGVGAAFGYSRKLRKRIKTSPLPEPMNIID